MRIDVCISWNKYNTWVQSKHILKWYCSINELNCKGRSHIGSTIACTKDHPMKSTLYTWVCHKMEEGVQHEWFWLRKVIFTPWALLCNYEFRMLTGQHVQQHICDRKYISIYIYMYKQTNTYIYQHAGTCEISGWVFRYNAIDYHTAWCGWRKIWWSLLIRWDLQFETNLKGDMHARYYARSATDVAWTDSMVICIYKDRHTQLWINIWNCLWCPNDAIGVVTGGNVNAWASTHSHPHSTENVGCISVAQH